MARNSSPLPHHVSPTRPCRPLFSRFQLYVKLFSALRELWVSVVLTRLESVKFSSDFWGEFDLFSSWFRFSWCVRRTVFRDFFSFFFTCGLEAAGAQAHSRVSTEKPPAPVDNSCFSLQVSDQSRLIRLTLFESKAARVGFRDAQPRPPIQMRPHIQPRLR